MHQTFYDYITNLRLSVFKYYLYVHAFYVKVK